MACDKGWVTCFGFASLHAGMLVALQDASAEHVSVQEASFHVSKALPTPPDLCWIMGQLLLTANAGQRPTHSHWGQQFE